jgi:hypothetical protein
MHQLPRVAVTGRVLSQQEGVAGAAQSLLSVQQCPECGI